MTIETPFQCEVARAKVIMLREVLVDSFKEFIPAEILKQAQNDIETEIRILDFSIREYEQRTRQGDPSKLAGK